MEVSLRGSYGVQLQPVKRAALSHHCDIAGLVASGTPLSLSSRLFSCFVVTGTGHANLLTTVIGWDAVENMSNSAQFRKSR